MTVWDHLTALTAAAPPGSLLSVPRDWLVEILDRQPATRNRRTTPPGDGAGSMPVTGPGPATSIAGWREQLWTCPPDTRLGVREVAEALGRNRSWVYRAAAAGRGAKRLPAARLGRELQFRAGEVREWIERTETTRGGGT